MKTTRKPTTPKHPVPNWPGSGSRFDGLDNPPIKQVPKQSRQKSERF